MKRPLSLLYRLTRRTLTFAYKRPRTTLGVGALLFLASLAAVPQLKILLGPDDLVGNDFPSGVLMRELERDFGINPSVLVRFRPAGPREGGRLEAADLEAIDGFLQALTITVPGVRTVLSPLSIRTATFRNDRLLYPKLADPAVPESLRGLSSTLWNGVLVDPVDPRRDLLAEIQFDHEFANPESYRAVGLAWENRPARPKSLEADWIGDLAYRVHMEEALGQVQVVNFALLALLILGFRYLFGTWKSGLLFAGSLIFTTTIMHGAMALVGSPIDTLSSTLFVMVTIASLEDFIFVSYARMREGPGPRRDRKVFRAMLFPGFLTSFTTFVGFLSLVVSDLSVIQRFGAWAAFGSAVECLATFVLIPALLDVFPSLREWTDDSKARGKGWLDRWQGATPSRWLTYASLAVFLAAGAMLSKIEVNDDPLAVFPEAHPLRKNLKTMMDSRGWMGEMSVVFPRFELAEMEAAEREFAKDPNVARIVNPARIIRDAQSGDGVKGRPLLEDLVGREFSEGKFFSRFVSEDRKSRMVLHVKSLVLKDLNSTIAAVNTACKSLGCYPAGSLVAYAEFSDHVLATLIESLGVSLFIVTLVILGLGVALGFGWRESLLPVALSTLFGPALMVCIQAGFHLDLNFFTSVVAGVLVGVSGDNAIQYLWAARKRNLSEGIDERGGGSVQCAVLMAISCLVMLGSPFQPARTLAFLFALGLLAVLYGDMTLLRGLLALMKRSEKSVKKPTRAS